MEEQQVAQVLRDFIVPRIPDEDVDYVEFDYRQGDVQQLLKTAEVVAHEHGMTLSEVFETAQ